MYSPLVIENKRFVEIKLTRQKSATLLCLTLLNMIAMDNRWSSFRNYVFLLLYYSNLQHESEHIFLYLSVNNIIVNFETFTG